MIVKALNTINVFKCLSFQANLKKKLEKNKKNLRKECIPEIPSKKQGQQHFY